MEATFLRSAPAAAPSPPKLAKELRRIHFRRAIGYYLQKVISSSSWIFYVVGLFWLLLLPRDEFHHIARVDENALLPGQTSKYFGDLDLWVATSYRDQIRTMGDPSKNVSGHAEFIEQEFRSFGLDASTQNFLHARHDEIVSGANAYAVFRAPRGDGTEAIVISAPWLMENGAVNAEGVSYVLAFAKFVTRFSHWAKDFIFLVTHPSPIGTQAWLEAYHGVQSDLSSWLQYDPLDRHGGVIHEAINLEFDGNGEYSAVGILVDGLNGLLPNADLVTTVVRCAQYEGLPVGIHNVVSPNKFDDNWTSYVHKADVIFEYMKSQALGVPTASHALYARYHIEAMTVRGLHDVKGTQYPITGHQIGRAIESALRSLNNLLERLHHAYWFYIMPTAQSFIPLSVYIPPVILLSVTLIIESLAMWWASGDLRQSPPARPNLIKGTEFADHPADMSAFNIRIRPLFLPVVTLVLCHAAGAIAFYLAPTVRFMALIGEINPFNMAATVVVVTATIYSFMIPTLQRMMEGSGASTATTAPAWMILKCLGCAELGGALIALSTLNPSLSVFLAIPSVPAFLLARPTESHYRFLLNVAAVTLASPIGLLGIMSLWEGLDVAQGVAGKVVDGWTLYGAWLLPFICFVYWPMNMVANVIIGMEE
ncbi:hypothetical protein SpCBS45565_g02244 [Spizellomyces sp. 'palustris']|nr:hypothetical protein SpCBS45565_g02244 [Spizellomyces sp. 'palustris']